MAMIIVKIFEMDDDMRVKQEKSVLITPSEDDENPVDTVIKKVVGEVEVRYIENPAENAFFPKLSVFYPVDKNNRKGW